MLLKVIIVIIIQVADAFFPKLFQLENTVKSVSKQVYNEENRIKLNNLCNDLAVYPIATYLQDLQGPWRILSEANIKHEYIYQVLDYQNKTITEKCKFMNGTLIETISPFVDDGSKVYFSYSKEVHKHPEEKSHHRYKTNSNNSFELIYASPSIRVEKNIHSGDIRVYEPTEVLEFKIDNVRYEEPHEHEPCSNN